MADNYLPLILGSFLFRPGFEGPNGWEDGLGDLGSEMEMIVKKFPGGVMTAQLEGSFPKISKIGGKFFGADARSRLFELQKLIDDGDIVTLSYAEWSFDGLAKNLIVHAHAPTEVYFTLEFQPLQNNSTYSGGAVSQDNSDPFSPIVSDAVATAAQQATTPANGYSMPPAVQNGVTTLNQTVNQQLQNSGGIVSGVTAAGQQLIQNQIAALIPLLTPLANGQDPMAASAAADLLSTLNIMNMAFSSAAQAQNLDALTSQQNPNLYQIAAYYYGDPDKWTLIANATNAAGLSQPLISDPFPIGSYALLIPVDTTAIAASSPVVFSNGPS